MQDHRWTGACGDCTESSLLHLTLLAARAAALQAAAPAAAAMCQHLLSPRPCSPAHLLCLCLFLLLRVSCTLGVGLDGNVCDLCVPEGKQRVGRRGRRVTASKPAHGGVHGVCNLQDQGVTPTAAVCRGNSNHTVCIVHPAPHPHTKPGHPQQTGLSAGGVLCWALGWPRSPPQLGGPLLS